MEIYLLYAFVVFHAALQCYGSDGLPAVSFNVNNTTPFVSMTTCEIIRYYEYPCEIHYVTTKDGYILTLHRIPHGMNGVKENQNMSSKEVAFLQHGLLDSSFTWVMNVPNRSLAYILADKGFDVWMGNSRGNSYSRKHTILTTDDVKFWDFSFDEMAKFDNPASIDYVLKQTGQKQVYYIGHSQGTMIGFAGFSYIPSLARKIKLFIALAPVAHVSHVKGLFKVISYGTWFAKQILAALGTKNFLPSGWVVKKIASIVCRGVSSRLCQGVFFFTMGYDVSNLDLDRLPIYVAHCPAGTSVKDIAHFCQLNSKDKFQMYDYGWNGNMHRYLQPYPPQYEVHNMKVPVALFSGTSDWLATEQDISVNLRGQLPNLIYDQEVDNFNHMDFLWGTHANEILYKNVIKLMQDEIPVMKTVSKRTL